MAVTILERPEGYILSPNGFDGDSYDFGGNYQIRMDIAHGLATGSVFFVVSDVDVYNGFFKVGAFDPTEIEVLTLGGENVPFIKVTEIVLYGITFTHGFSAVHLPITYKLSNTRWPVNSVDTARTIISLNDDLGYARITLSGSLGTFEDLSFVKISSAPNSDFDGVYQILDKLSTTNITLSVAYSTFNNAGLLGATIQLYYGNYNIVVRVYAGINSSHEWTAQKPYELAATLELIPESDNTVLFSVNEILKAYVKSVNNLLLGTMPNNIDAWVNFYISIAEQYDSSDGYTVGTTLSSFTSDQSNFEGTAVNAVLPFKNIYSGHLSAYLMTNNTAKFLTLFTIPVLFSCGDDTPDCYSDISFLLTEDNYNVTIRKQFYLNGNLGTTTDTSLGVLDKGVIRAELEADCNYDRVDITVIGEPEDVDLSDFTQILSGGTWVYQATADWGIANPVLHIDNIEGFVSSKVALLPYAPIGEAVVTITGQWIAHTNSAGDRTYYVQYELLDESQNSLQVYNNNPGTAIALVPDVITTQSHTFTAQEGVAFIAIKVAPKTGGTTGSFDIEGNFEGNLVGGEISETKQFDIDCGCADQEIRLTWLNYLGGFDYWVFNTETGKAIDILNTTETTKNIFPEWPKSYGENADTIRKQVSRESTNRLFFTTQYLTEDQADALAYIKTSPLVQIINSRSDRRTIIVDSDSFTKYTDNQKLITISFSARYTDNIGSQKV